MHYTDADNMLTRGDGVIAAAKLAHCWASDAADLCAMRARADAHGARSAANKAAHKLDAALKAYADAADAGHDTWRQRYDVRLARERYADAQARADAADGRAQGAMRAQRWAQRWP